MAHGQKTGGRTSGTPNKATADMKARIKILVDNQFDTIIDDLNLLEPKDRVTAYLKFLEYILPKQREQIIRETGNVIVRRDETGNIVIETVDEDEDES